MESGNKEKFVIICRKWIVAALTGGLLLSGAVCAFAAESGGAAMPAGGKVQVYLKPDVVIIVNGTERIFRDVNGEVVYPIIFNGSTYLPVRAISGLMQEDIEWDDQNKIIFMGRTFSNPNKVHRPESDSDENSTEVIENESAMVRPLATMISAYSRPNFLVAYDFEFLVFKDEIGHPVFPIVVNGSTYLPIRAVSEIMKETIDWDGINKIITIGSAEVPVVEKSEAVKTLVSQFERQITLYDSATVKIKNLQKSSNPDDLMIIATEVSKDYAMALENITAVDAMKTTAYNAREMEAYDSLVEFSRMSEHYILVLENIAYLAAAEQDYMVLAETFVMIARDSQNKLDDTRALIDAL